MSTDTKIEYVDATINWWAGCTPISPACDNCYAKPFAKRLFGVDWGTDAPRRQFQGAYASLMALDRKAKRQGRPLVVFHNSLSDFFDNAVPVQWRYAAMGGIVDTPNLIHLLVTKRIGNAAAMLEQAFRAVTSQREGWADNVLPNVWLIATISNQAEADRDLPKLERVPAARHGVSIEPMLGGIDLKLMQYHDSDNTDEQGRIIANTRRRWLSWIIVGGESGANARPMHPDWVRSLRDQCQVAGVPFFFKQWGEWICAGELRRLPGGGMPGFGSFDGCRHDMASDTVRVGKKAAGRLLDGREWNGVPA